MMDKLRRCIVDDKKALFHRQAKNQREQEGVS